MIKVKHYILLPFIFLIFNFPLFAFSAQNRVLENPFPSELNLKNFSKEKSLDNYDIQDLNNTKISLITIAPGKEIYSWFGHSALMVEQNDNVSIIYDYGIFSFNSEDFYKNFIQGKMYYLLLPSYSKARLEAPMDEDRTITKLVLNISNVKKIDIINFLNYNAKSDNNTYLYDFYDDNCATRIRDIINWITDDDFKNWAQKESFFDTYRSLSSEVLDSSLFVNWVLNSFLGNKCDSRITIWQKMFLPEYLESSIKEYGKIGTEEIYLYKTNSSSVFETKKSSNHIIFYCIFGFILGSISLFFKGLKQNNENLLFGIFNSVIILFLLIVSTCIFYLTIFSHIQPAWYNENIYILNPFIFFILFILSLMTLSRKNRSTFYLIIFENASMIYSGYLISILILKSLLTNIVYQNNIIIILPIFIYFFVQSFIFRTSR